MKLPLTMNIYNTKEHIFKHYIM